MSLKPSKKTLIKLSAAPSNSHDPAADPALSIQPSSHGGRSRKSFFSFKPTAKRSLVRPAAGHEAAESSNSMIQFPLVKGNTKSGPNQSPSTNSPPQLPLPTRTLRSSILFSQQFDFKYLGSGEDPVHRDPSPTSLLSDTTSRPSRSTTRPSSWMMLNDGTYAPSLKVQGQYPPQSDQHSPESFYNRSPARVPRRVDSSDDEGSSQASAINWNRQPSVPHAQQPSHLKGISAGYQLQIQTQDLLPHIPPRPRMHIGSRSASKPASVSFPNAPSAPKNPPKNCDYSPLAAFLGQSKSASPVIPKNSALPSSSTPSGLLSAFLGGQPAEFPLKNQSIAPLSPVPPTPQLSMDCIPKFQPAEQSARLEEPIHLEKPIRLRPISKKIMPEVEERVVKSTSDGAPMSHSLTTSRVPSQLASGKLKDFDVIHATGTDRSSVREQPKTPSSIIPSCSTVTLAPSISSSPRSSTCYTPSNLSASTLERRQKSASRDSSTSNSGSCDLNKLGCGSRKRSVENVYLDSSSQHSSTCSDNFSSVGDAVRKCAVDSDLSGAYTAPSSTRSHQSSPSEKTLESLKDPHEEPDIKIEDTEKASAVERCDLGSRRVIELKSPPTDVRKSATDGVSDNSEEEAEAEDEAVHRRTIDFEYVLLHHPEILRKVISHLDYLDFFSLSQITNDFLEELESDPRLRETVLKRYLTGFGYRTCSTRFMTGHKKRELPMITLDDLANFYAGLEFESLELIEYAKQALNRRGLDYRTAKMIRSSTRAHNKLVAYMRAVEELSPRPGSQQYHPHRHAGRLYEHIYRPGKAPIFKVWVPSVDHWMSNEELSECERELWRSQIWTYLEKGDVCWNLAIGDFANEGKLVFDGRFLRDLLFEFDEVGHLPSWLDMLEFPPSYFHKIIASSTSTPIFYLDISPYKDEIKKNLKLSEDKVEVASPQARYRVQRWVYRSVITIHTGQWTGHVVIEVEGTSEQAKNLLKRCCSSHGGVKNLTPWRIIREKSRPGKLWIRPVNDDERIS